MVTPFTAGAAAVDLDAAQQLASAYSKAANALRKATPGPAERAAHERLLASLGKIAEGYEIMASGARAEDASRFARGSQTVRAATRSVTEIIVEFTTLGYELSGHSH